MSLALTSKIETLKKRAEMLKIARHFFESRYVLEVDVPLLSRTACIDLHIDLVEAIVNGKKAYLHSSPEYGMKKLLAEGSGDIYQISHVFRDKEVGERHNPEFTMVEWYRVGFSFQEMIDETLEFIRLFIDAPTQECYSFDEVFHKFLGKGYRSFDDWIETLAIEIEPQLTRDALTVIYDYPPENCALARKVQHHGVEVSKRFEVYYQGVELANGYDELICAAEQKKRLLEANTARIAHKKNPYPLDEDFLQALENGLPEVCGVAVGFDRLLMQQLHAEHISEVVPLSWK